MDDLEEEDNPLSKVSVPSQKEVSVNSHTSLLVIIFFLLNIDNKQLGCHKVIARVAIGS